MDEKVFWQRSGFWPQVGTTLVLVGSWLEGDVSLVALLAAVLTSWGIFLGAAKASPSVATKKVDEVVERRVEANVAALEKVTGDLEAYGEVVRLPRADE